MQERIWQTSLRILVSCWLLLIAPVCALISLSSRVTYQDPTAAINHPEQAANATAAATNAGLGDILGNFSLDNILAMEISSYAVVMALVLLGVMSTIFVGLWTAKRYYDRNKQEEYFERFLNGGDASRLPLSLDIIDQLVAMRDGRELHHKEKPRHQAASAQHYADNDDVDHAADDFALLAQMEKEKAQAAKEQAEEEKRLAREAKEQAIAEEKARKEAEKAEKARLKEEEKAAKLAAKEQERLEKERIAAEKKAAEEQARLEAEEKARLEAEEKARLKAAEEQARLEAEEKARRDAEGITLSGIKAKAIADSLLSDDDDEDTYQAPAPKAATKKEKSKASKSEKAKAEKSESAADKTDKATMAVQYRFNMELESICRNNDYDAFSVYAIHVAGVPEAYDRDGKAKVDKYLDELYQAIRSTFEEALHHFRLSDTDYYIIHKLADEKKIRSLAIRFESETELLRHHHQLATPASLGVVLAGKQSHDEILSQVDIAQDKAARSRTQQWHLTVLELPEAAQETAPAQPAPAAKAPEPELPAKDSWQQLIEQTIEFDKARFVEQSIRPFSANFMPYEEMLLRLNDANNNEVDNIELFEHAKHYELDRQLEQYLVESALCRMTGIEADRLKGINITSDKALTKEFIEWFDGVAKSHKQALSQVVFEMPEKLISSNIEMSEELLTLMRAYGAHICVSDFGSGLHSFRLIHTLKFDFVKISTSITSQIPDDSAATHYARTLIDTAQRQSVKVIAENVEEIEQKEALEELRIDGMQGFILSHPAELPGYAMAN